MRRKCLDKKSGLPNLQKLDDATLTETSHICGADDEKNKNIEHYHLRMNITITERQTPLADIATDADVERLVRLFYARVQRGDVLMQIFDPIVKGAWEEHLERITLFWQTLLLQKAVYKGNPMQKHLPLPLEEVHFVRWLGLFVQTLDESFSGETANEAKRKALHIASVMKTTMGITTEITQNSAYTIIS